MLTVSSGVRERVHVNLRQRIDEDPPSLILELDTEDPVFEGDVIEHLDFIAVIPAHEVEGDLGCEQCGLLQA